MSCIFKISKDHKALDKEYQIYNTLRHIRGFPTVKGRGRIAKFEYLVLENVGTDLQKLYSWYPEIFDTNMVGLIGREMVGLFTLCSETDQ